MESTMLPKPPGTEPEWGAELLDLEAYLARIGYTGPRTPTLDTLRAVHHAHATTISWEIVDSALGRYMALDLPTLQKKIVDGGQGGCCLETNLLFAAALERLGFPVARHLARVRRGSQRIRTRSHLVLLVEVEGSLWMADPGFGDESPLEPLPFVDGGRVTVGDWTWRLDHEGAEWVLRCLHADGWFDVYAFQLERHHPIDLDMIVHFSYVDPNSVFVGRLLAQRGSATTRHVLRDHVFTTRHADGRSASTELTGAQIVDHLRTTFGLALSPEDAQAVAERFGVDRRDG